MGSWWAGVEPEVLSVCPFLEPPLPKFFCAFFMNWCLQLGGFCASLSEIQVLAEVLGGSFCSGRFGSCWGSISSPHHPGLSFHGCFLPASTGQLWKFRKEKKNRIIKMLKGLSGVQVSSWAAAGQREFSEFSSFRPLRAVSTESSSCFLALLDVLGFLSSFPGCSRKVFECWG